MSPPLHTFITKDKGMQKGCQQLLKKFIAVIDSMNIFYIGYENGDG